MGYIQQVAHTIHKRKNGIWKRKSQNLLCRMESFMHSYLIRRSMSMCDRLVLDPLLKYF